MLSYRGPVGDYGSPGGFPAIPDSQHASAASGQCALCCPITRPSDRARAIAGLLRSAGSADTAWAMSQDNVEIVRREYATFVTRDWEALAELCHPDLEYETWGPPGQLRGFRE